ncbi:MAG: 1,2-phenylacetyl-CoA epoxidase subunit PaaD [Candidatus Dormibacteria bacterium]
MTRPASATTLADVRRALGDIPDPEIPVLTIEDLGILRDVRVSDGGGVDIDITPTYSGCPALDVIRDDVEQRTRELGFVPRVNVVLSPAWTTDWMSDDARRRLREHGVAPPRHRDGALRLLDAAVACPVCGSAHTEEVAHFASTPCQALRRCEGCSEPFQHFKEH